MKTTHKDEIKPWVLMDSYVMTSPMMLFQVYMQSCCVTGGCMSMSTADP